MNPSELYRAGRLREAVDAQIQVVRNQPADQGHRTFLFTMLAFGSDLGRARKQLDVLKYDEVERDATVQLYRQLLEAEQQRRDFFSTGGQPKLVDPNPDVQLRLETVELLRQGKHQEASAQLADANAQLPVQAGTWNDLAFDYFRDLDDLGAGVLEAFVRGAYTWVPWSSVRSLASSPPKTPRDLLWIPARLELTSGETGEVFLPALYPGTHDAADETIQLGQQTVWHDELGYVRGLGQKVFLLGKEDVPLLDVRTLQFMA